MIISENIPRVQRGQVGARRVRVPGVGALAGTGVGYMVLSIEPHWMPGAGCIATAVIPALLVTIGRFYITESANWLSLAGEKAEAERAMPALLVRTPRYPKEITLPTPRGPQQRTPQAPPSRRCSTGRTGAQRSWPRCHGSSRISRTYGIGIFTPTILAAAIGRSDHIRSLSDLILKDIIAAKGAALIDVAADRRHRVCRAACRQARQHQVADFGFIGCAVGLLLASFSAGVSGPARIALIFSGFMLFNFMTNLGPNAQTYLLAGEVFPTEVRGMGAASPQPSLRSARSPPPSCFRSCYPASAPAHCFGASLSRRSWVPSSPGSIGSKRPG